MKYKLFLTLLVLTALLLSISRLDITQRETGRQQLEQALRRSAVACYAAEGAYPPSVEYLERHYGLQYDRTTYTIHYTVSASNLMPDITVLVNSHETD